MAMIFKSAAVAVALLSAAAASAATYTFTVTSDVQSIPGNFSYVPNYTFQLDSNPTPDVSDSGSFTIYDVATTGYRPALGPGGTETYTADYSFLLAPLGGFDDGGAEHNYSGPVLFTGDPSAPQFKTGSFRLTGISGASNATLVISDPNATGDVPEPATWGTMLLGFGLAGVALRRRRAVTARA